MFNNEDILMGSSKKPIVFNIVYFTQNRPFFTPPLTFDYTDPTTGQKVTHSIWYGESYSFQCAIGDTVKFYYLHTGGTPERGYAYDFFNGVDVSPTSGQVWIEPFPPGDSRTFTITGKSPFLNYNIC